MPVSSVLISADERVARSLLGVLPETERSSAKLIHLGSAAREDLLGLPVAHVVHFPEVDVRTASTASLANLVDPHIPPAGLAIADSTQWSRDLAGYIVDRREAVVVWAIDRLSVTGPEVLAEHVVLGGSHRLIHRLEAATNPVLVLAKPIDTIDEIAVTEPRLVTDSSRADNDGSDSQQNGSVAEIPSLAGARVIVCVGNGIASADRVPLFEDLADALGGALGATRAVVDSGWLPFAHQIGQTGESVSPDLYLGFGVSGAAQHLAGMRAAKQVVAVNTDPNAPLCRLADVVVEADATEFAEKLIATHRVK